jgi:hypothetical protein
MDLKKMKCDVFVAGGENARLLTAIEARNSRAEAVANL